MHEMGEPKIKIVAMPKDTNAAGNIFGGWIMSQMDIAGSLAARELSPDRVVTVAVNSMSFKKPVYVGDAVCCYAKIVKVGNSSIQTEIEVVAERANLGKIERISVTSAVITYVSVDKDGVKKPIVLTNNQKKLYDR